MGSVVKKDGNHKHWFGGRRHGLGTGVTSDKRCPRSR